MIESSKMVPMEPISQGIVLSRYFLSCEKATRLMPYVKFPVKERRKKRIASPRVLLECIATKVTVSMGGGLPSQDFSL